MRLSLPRPLPLLLGSDWQADGEEEEEEEEEEGPNVSTMHLRAVSGRPAAAIPTISQGESERLI